MAKTLTLKFAKGRLISSEVNGVQGPNCLESTRKYLEGLNINPDDFKDEHKPEFDEMPQVESQGQG